MKTSIFFFMSVPIILPISRWSASRSAWASPNIIPTYICSKSSDKGAELDDLDIILFNNIVGEKLKISNECCIYLDYIITLIKDVRCIVSEEISIWDQDFLLII